MMIIAPFSVIAGVRKCEELHVLEPLLTAIVTATSEYPKYISSLEVKFNIFV